MIAVFVEKRNDFGELKVVLETKTKYPNKAKKILSKYNRGFLTCANGKVIHQLGF